LPAFYLSFHLFVFFGKLDLVDMRTHQKVRIAGILNAHFAEHLAHNHFDVFVIEAYALEPIDFLDFIDQVFLQAAFSRNAQDVLRNHGTVDSCMPAVTRSPL